MHIHKRSIDMEKYANDNIGAEEIETLVRRYLEQARREAATDKTAEEQKIIEMIMEQATF